MIKYLLTFIFYFFALSAYGGMIVSSIEFKCDNEKLCKDYKLKFNSLIGSFENRRDFSNKLKYFLFEEGIHRFSYELKESKKDLFDLEINLELKKEVKRIVFNQLDRDINLSKVITIKEGEYFEIDKLKENEKRIKRYLKDKGYFKSTVKTESIEHQNHFDVQFIIKLGKPVLIGDIEVLSTNKVIKNKIYKKMKTFKGEPADITNLKLSVESLTNDLISKGYFFSKISLDMPKMTRKSSIVKPVIKIKRGDRFVFGVHGNKKISKFRIISEIKKVMSKKTKNNIEKGFKKTIIDLYEKFGYWDTEVNSRLLLSKSIRDRSIEKRYYFDIKEGQRIRVKDVSFINNSFFSQEELLDFYLSKGDDISSRMFLNEDYALKFQNLLQDEYVRNGHLFAKIKLRKLKRVAGSREVSLEYYIDEGIESIVTSIAIPHLNQEMTEQILAKLTNKKDSLFNPFQIDRDLSTVHRELKDRGYILSSSKSRNPKDIIKYSANFKQVKIFFDFHLKNRILLSKVVVGGNLRTKNKVILRESGLAEGEILTPQKIEEIQDRLSSLGIFANVKIDLIHLNEFQLNPFDGQDEFVDLLIQVQEKKSGFFEIAPGYRTDIGFKLSSAIGHNNLNGMNRSVRFQWQVNQRANFDTFDARRRALEQNKLEYFFKLNYVEPYLLGKPFSWQSSASISRKRFFSFDADISKVNTSFRKSWSNRFATNLSYQLEAIKQSDATNEIDEGFFRIGGITPGFTLDLRDNAINTQKGAFLDWSIEFANPTFFSLDRDDLEINFYKFVMRNKFYTPLFSGVLALSTSFGLQKNLATDLITDASGSQVTKGFIPSIKVFRLNGVDLVRGFDDDEINIVQTGRDINNETVRDKAYFTNFRLEYRHYITDDIVLGSFVDGGGIYLDSFTPHSFRSSAGLSLKYLTPVGSLDFDYGFKLHRKRTSNGELESPGRFHVSIGFF